VALAVLLAVYAVPGSFGRSQAGASTLPKADRVKPLVGPKTTSTEDTSYLADVAKADQDLATYIQKQGNVALRALLTDGSAFCAFLHRGGGIDNAILSVAVGAKSVESKTHLPSNIATYNTMEAVALLTLCPSEQKVVPSTVRARLRALGRELAK
jgi:hypothetical protein